MDLSKILGAVDAALGVIKTVADTPGVNLLPYASTVSSAVSAIQLAEQAGKDIAPFVEALANTFSGGVPTQDQLDALDAKIAELRAELHAPLPDPEQGEPT